MLGAGAGFFVAGGVAFTFLFSTEEDWLFWLFPVHILIGLGLGFFAGMSVGRVVLKRKQGARKRTWLHKRLRGFSGALGAMVGFMSIPFPLVFLLNHFQANVGLQMFSLFRWCWGWSLPGWNRGFCARRSPWWTYQQAKQPFDRSVLKQSFNVF